MASSKYKVTKAVIPAAGLGTRFLPATKALPKEMLPIVDKPVIQFVVEEAVLTGLSDLLMITGRNKNALENHFFSWLIGGLNYQVEHHLFPDICHVHYRKIAPIVKATAAEFNIPYYSKKTFFDALKAHAKMLHQLGTMENQPLPA